VPSGYAIDTEILTRNGWKLFAKLTDEDEVATRSESGLFEWQQPSARHACDYDGKLIRFASRGIGLLVTPNHRVLHTSGHGSRPSELVKRADECEQLRSGAMIGTSTWNAPDLAWFDVPPCQSQGYVAIDIQAFRDRRDELGWTREQLADKCGTTARAILRMELGTGTVHVATLPRIKAICEALRVPGDCAVKPDPLARISGDDFAAFMGAYASEGCVSAGNRGHLRIFISQSPGSKGVESYRALLTRILGREPHYDGHSWVFYHEGLATYLRQCGHSAPEKRIPAEVLDLSARQLRIFLDFYRLGDGWTTGNGEAFTTTSSVLAGQIQEVAQKIGLSATVYRRESKPRGRIRGRLIGSTYDRYDIFLRTTKRPRWTWTERVEYEGTVYCVSVPNGIIYVRRNGKAIWSGIQAELAPAYRPSRVIRCLLPQPAEIFRVSEDRN
jgi:transcriptional regulator with XRE-family HTH domain